MGVEESCLLILRDKLKKTTVRFFSLVAVLTGIRIGHPLNMSVALTLEIAPRCSYCLFSVHKLSKFKSLFGIMNSSSRSFLL
jgi:hypothetical protein